MESTSHAAPEHVQHGTPLLYVKTYAFLVVMMVVTILFSKIQLGPLNNLFAMAIALAKATAVVLLFMQVKFSTRLTWVWAALGFIWLFLLFGIMGDYFTRVFLSVAGWSPK